MNDLVYCIKHEQMVLAEGACCVGHTYPVFIVDVGIPARTREEQGFCDFPLGFASCAPPEVEEDWIEHMVEDETYRDLVIDGLDRYGSL